LIRNRRRQSGQERVRRDAEQRVDRQWHLQVADGGDSWTNMGLANSERIAKIIIDPKEGNTVYVCLPGKLWSDSEDRGVYKPPTAAKAGTRF